MRIAILIFALVALAQSAVAQTLDSYLKVRRQYKITQAVGVESLQSFVGSRVVEVSGTVRGSIKGQNSYFLLLEVPNSRALMVESENPPAWLLGNVMKCRLIVEARRESEMGILEAKLLSAATEEEIATIDARLNSSAKRASSKSSRSGVRMPAAPSASASKNWELPASDAVPYYAKFIKGVNKKLSEDQAYEIARGILGFSIKFGVDARLVMAMVMVESDFDPNCTSNKGAAGLGQLMPDTAASLGVSNMYDTNENLYGTVKLLRSHLDKYQAKKGETYEALTLALAAYNAGPGAVKKHGGVPPYRETQNYVRKVISLYDQFCGK